MRTALVLAIISAAAGIGVCARVAHGADFAIETLGVDGGATPPVTGASNAPKYSGNEIAIRCTNGDARLKVCETGTTCTAVTSSGQYLNSDREFPVCFPNGWGKASIIQSDAGVSVTCEFRVVNPKQTCP